MTSERTGSPAKFRLETTAVLSDFRSRLIDLLDTVPGNVRKSRDVQKFFGLDAKLSWQLFRIVAGGDPLELTQHIPTSTPMRKLLDAAKRKGASPTLVGAASDAFESYERYVAMHAGDRKVFDSMLADLTDGTAAAQVDLHHRKLTFECHRHYWGVQVQTQIWATLLHPGSDPANLLDVASVRSAVGLERLRAGAPAVLDHLNPFGRGSLAEASALGSLDPDAFAKHGLPALPRFSSSPLPSMTLERLSNGVEKITLAGDDVGRQAASQVSFGRVRRGLPCQGHDGGSERVLVPTAAFVLPTQLFMVDFLVHRPSFSTFGQELSLYGHAGSWSETTGYEKVDAKLPCRERVVFLGTGPAALRTPEVPHYVKMVGFVCDRLNWNIDEFDVYRTSIQFPMLDTALVSRLKWEQT